MKFVKLKKKEEKIFNCKIILFRFLKLLIYNFLKDLKMSWFHRGCIILTHNLG
jgi:hypothetical protein